MKGLHISALALASAMVSLPWQAGAEALQLDEIVITPNRSESARNRTGVSVSAVGAVDLRAGPQASVGQVLSRLPGVYVSSQGPAGSPMSMRIRGADQRYIAVVVDGVRVSDPTNVQTSFDLGTLSASDVSRLEVLRGSQSALWGGSAVGGVVTVTSARPTEDGLHQEAQVELGTYATHNLRYGLTQKSGDLEAALTLSHQETAGYSAAASGTEADASDSSRISASLRWQANEALAIGASVFAQKGYNEFDGYNDFYELVDEDNRTDRSQVGGRIFAELEAGATKHIFDVTAYKTSRDYVEDALPSSYDGDRLTLGWQATTTVSDTLSVLYGADWMREGAEYSHLPGGVADTDIAGAFAQVNWAARPNLDISAAARVDDNSTFGSFGTGRLAVAYRPDDQTTLRAAVASGFRAPSIDERFGDYPEFFFTGNPDLTPETSMSYEIGAEREFANGATVSATLFKLDIDNLIASTSDYSTLENTEGTSTRQGLELAASLPLGEKLTLGVAYTYTDAQRDTGRRLALVPYHDLTLTLDATVTDRLTAGLAVKHVAGRLDDFAAFAMPDYTVVTAQARYDLGSDAEAYLRVENLFDADYQTSNGFASSGRALYVGLRKSF